MSFAITQRRVLVLDPGMQPINIISVKRAFVLLFSSEERARVNKHYRKPQVLEYSRDGTIVGIERTIRVPSVIQLCMPVPFFRSRARFCRKNVLVGRDRGVCQYCGSKERTEDLTFDHVVPRAQGGQTTWENVVACCVPCNQKKAGRTPEQAGMRLLKKPVRPAHLLDTKVKGNPHDAPPEWGAYWTVTLHK